MEGLRTGSGLRIMLTTFWIQGFRPKPFTSGVWLGFMDKCTFGKYNCKIPKCKVNRDLSIKNEHKVFNAVSFKLIVQIYNRKIKTYILLPWYEKYGSNYQ